jgi:hypothetical protein
VIRRLPLGAALLTLVGLSATALTPALGHGTAARPSAIQQFVPGSALPPLPAAPMSVPPVAVDPGALTPGIPQQVTVRVGDTVLVDGARLGCQVNRRGGRVFIECGRAGDVGGTYMTLVGKRTVMVARLRSAKTAQVILTAKHGGGWRACGMKARAARAGGRGCR